MTINIKTDPENLKLSDLEKTIQYEREIVNEVELQEKDRKVKYVGEVVIKDIKFGSMSGNVTLTRYDVYPVVRKRKRMVRVFPPKFENEEVQDEKEQRVWRISSCKYHNSGDLIVSFIENGKLVEGYSNSYRGFLKTVADEKKIFITHELFNLVFKPIDQIVLEIYNTLGKFEKQPGES